MGIPIEIPGLSQFINEIPDGSIISIEGGVDHPKMVLAQTLVRTALEQRRQLIYIAPPGECGLMDQLPRWGELKCKCTEEVDGKDLRSWAEHVHPNSVVLVDSLSYLMLGGDASTCMDVLETMRTVARQNAAVVICIVEDGLLPRELSMINGYHSDGIIQFLIRDSPDGVSRFMRVTKWMSGASYDRNIYYNYIEGKINVDLRYRVV